MLKLILDITPVAADNKLWMSNEKVGSLSNTYWILLEQCQEIEGYNGERGSGVLDMGVWTVILDGIRPGDIAHTEY